MKKDVLWRMRPAPLHEHFYGHWWQWALTRLREKIQQFSAQRSLLSADDHAARCAQVHCSATSTTPVLLCISTQVQINIELARIATEVNIVLLPVATEFPHGHSTYSIFKIFNPRVCFCIGDSAISDMIICMPQSSTLVNTASPTLVVKCMKIYTCFGRLFAYLLAVIPVAVCGPRWLLLCLIFIMSIPKAKIHSLVVQEQTLVYNSIAATAFIIWDHIITFEQEVDLVWKSRFGPVNFLFFVIRYLTFAIRVAFIIFYANVDHIIHPPKATCKKWMWFEAFSGQILFAAVEILLIFRVYAFYGRNKYLLAGLIVAFLLELGAQFGIAVFLIPDVTTVPTPLPTTLDLWACTITKLPNAFHNYWTPGLIFESILFILVVVKFIRTKFMGLGYSPQLLVVFVRDGIWAFVLLFAVLLWAELPYALSNQKGDIALTWIYSMLAFCGTRVTLNLRIAAKEQNRESTLDVDSDAEFRAALPESCDTGTARTASGD